MKRILTILLLISVALSFASCTDYRDNPTYSTITYKEKGLEISLRNDMNRYESEEYDFYFANTIGTILFTAFELDGEFLAKNSLSADITAGEYVDYILKKSGLDKDELYYEENTKKGVYSFRYTFDDQNSSKIFYYVVILGEPGNVWYVEMTCANDDSERYLARFEDWRNTIKTYNEQN